MNLTATIDALSARHYSLQHYLRERGTWTRARTIVDDDAAYPGSVHTLPRDLELLGILEVRLAAAASANGATGRPHERTGPPVPDDA
jgi:hypothetical protein